MENISNHFQETRLRFIYIIYTFICTFFTCYWFQIEIIYLLTKPFLELHQTLIATDITEAFFSVFKVCFAFSFLFSLPIFGYHSWCFFSPSFYKSEAKKINIFIFLFIFLFLIEALYIYSSLFPKICEYFTSYQIGLPDSTTNGSTYKGIPQMMIEISPRISSYIKYCLQIYFGLLLIFQLPFIFLFLFYAKICTAIDLSSKRPLFFLFFLSLSALCSPPDIWSQSFLTLILCFLFELCLFIGYIFHAKLRN